MQRIAAADAFLDGLATQLLACTTDMGAPDAAPLPCTETVIALTRDLQDLLFPGIRRRLSSGNPCHVASCVERLNAIAGTLSQQVVLALQHVRHATLRLHAEPSALQQEADQLVQRFLLRLPELHALLMSDVQAAFEKDPATKAVAMMGEIGGSDEEEAARWVKANMKKPVVGFIAGVTAPPGKRMGHAGAIISGGNGTAQEKLAVMESCGIKVTKNPAEMGKLLKSVLK